MAESSPDLLSKIHRLEFLLVVTFLFALLPWVGLAYAGWKLSRPELLLGDKLVAQSIELRSKEGATLVRLSADDFGGNMQLSTPEGKAIVKVIAGANGGDVTLCARDGGKFAHLGSGAGKGASLLLNGASGRQTVYLGSEDDDSGNLSINNKEGEISVVLRDNDGHGGGVSTYKDRKHQLAFFGGVEHDAAAFMLWNSEGENYAQISTNDLDNGYLRLGSAKTGHIDLGVGTSDVPFATLYSPGSQGFFSFSSPQEGGWWALGDADGVTRVNGTITTDSSGAVKIFGVDKKEVSFMGECESGGLFQTNARSGNLVFQAGCGSEGGNGHIQLYHANGSRAVWLGSADDDSGGMIRIRDLQGNILLDAP